MSVPEDGIPGWGGAELARAIHACESRALIAFYSHFRPMLAERAQLFGIPTSECPDAVETFLGDMLLSLAAGKQLPRRLHGYVLVSFRRFAARSGKANRLEAGMLTVYGETVEHFVPAGRVAEPQSQYETPANSVLAKFADRLLSGLGSEDRFLLGAKAEEMPLREIAALLDLNYNAANTRLFRLRAQLRTKAAEIAATMDGADRLLVERFLRRAGANTASATEAGEQDNAAPRRFSNG